MSPGRNGLRPSNPDDDFHKRLSQNLAYSMSRARGILEDVFLKLLPESFFLDERGKGAPLTPILVHH